MKRLTERDGRGQMILVGALLLAVTLVALALVTNSVIYTENLASRDEVNTDDAVVFRQAAADGSQRAIVESNFGRNDSSYAQRNATFRQAVRTWGEGTTGFLSTSGVSGQVVPGSLTRGTRVSQDDVGEFTPVNEDVILGIDPLGVLQDGWLAAPDTKLRQFEMTVQRDELYERPSTITGSLLDLLLGTDEPFFFATEDDDGDNYYTFVYRNPNPTPDSIEVVSYRWPDGESATKIGQCSVQASEATIDVTGGRVIAGNQVESCSALDYYDEVTGSPDTYFANGDQVEGTYHFIADRPQEQFRDAVAGENNDLIGAIVGGTVSVLNDGSAEFLNLDLDSLDLLDPLPTLSDSDTYYDQSTSGSPYTNTAVWSADVRVDYQTKSVSYQSTMRIAPGLPGEESSPAAGGGATSPGNSPPTAEFDSKTTVDAGETFSLDASASSDSDGSVTSYEWDFDEDGAVDAPGQTVSHSYSAAGSYDVVLTVTDDDGATDTRTQTVHVISTTGSKPEVESLSVTDRSTSGEVSYDADWDVHDDDGDLGEVTVALYRDKNKNDQQVDSTTITSIAGTDADRTTTVSWSSGNVCKKDLYVRVTVSDTTGKTASQKTSTLDPSC